MAACPLTGWRGRAMGRNGLDRMGVGELDRAIAAHRAAGGLVLAASHVPMSGDWHGLELGS